MEDIRRRRINEDGEWEYECVSCREWLLKNKFKGCLTNIYPYGNCLSCRSCISKNGSQKRINSDQIEMIKILIRMGYDPSSEIPVYKQVEERHKEKYGRYFNNDNI
jgi:hypothetical protein